MAKPDAVAEKNADKKAASDDNFANGYYEHNKNGAADQGLANALEHNGKGDANDTSVIDFDSGEWTITYQYDYGYYSYMYGTYSEDGFTVQWSTYEDDYYYYDNSTIDVPFFDADGDGDNEFGVNVIGEDTDYYYDYEYAYMHITADSNGNTWNSDNDVSLVSFDFNYTPDSSYYYNTYLNVYANDVDLGDTGQYESYSWAQAYTYDGVTWNIYNQEYDYTTGASTYIYGTTTDMAVVYSLFDSMDYIAFSMSEEFTVDNIGLETETALAA